MPSSEVRIETRLLTPEEKDAIRRAGPRMLFGGLGCTVFGVLLLILAILYWPVVAPFYAGTTPYSGAQQWEAQVESLLFLGTPIALFLGLFVARTGIAPRASVAPILESGRATKFAGMCHLIPGGKGAFRLRIGPHIFRMGTVGWSPSIDTKSMPCEISLEFAFEDSTGRDGTRGWLLSESGKARRAPVWVVVGSRK